MTWGRRSESFPSLIGRFWDRVEKSDTCWLWQGARTSSGYGDLQIAHRKGEPRRRVRAHRFAYEITIGPIPSGLILDHLCRNRLCVRPDHLQPVTIRENTLRGTSIPALNAKRTHCKQGHLLDGTYRRGERVVRYCMTCNRERVRARRLAS